MHDDEFAPEQASQAARSKRPYKVPRLEVYGSATELTKGVGGSHFDPGHSNNSKAGMG